MNDKAYLDIARTVAKNSTCLKRQYGAIIVKNDEIIATGYNGPPRRWPHCTKCAREGMKSNCGTYAECKSVHAEMNCVIQASRKDMIGSTMYLVGLDGKSELYHIEPCNVCTRLIINAGIEKVITETTIWYINESKVTGRNK